MDMAEKKIAGYVKSENVIWFVAASLLVGFVAGVAFGIYKSGAIVDPHQTAPPAGMDVERQQANRHAQGTDSKKPPGYGRMDSTGSLLL
jgi:hypothetical protein